MHACGVSLAVAEHHSVSWAADLDQDSQGILTSDLCTQLHELVIFSHRHYRGHLAGTQPPSEAGGGGPPRRRTAEAEDRRGGHCRTGTARRAHRVDSIEQRYRLLN